MKQLRFFATIGVAAASLFFSSCNSDEGKKADDKNADSTAVKTETPAPPPMPSGPMMVMTIKHKVANYAKWKPFYDGHDSARQANGLHNYVIARGTQDPNMVLIALKMDDVEKAKAMATSPGTKEIMKKAGVTGPTTFDYLESVMNDTTNIMQTERVMVTSKVKDWDAWKKSFDSHKQVRLDSGLIDRVIAHTVGDNHMVTLVFAITDLKKAKAFMNSKDLKDRMAEAGVVGPPSFFYYKIVATY